MGSWELGFLLGFPFGVGREERERCRERAETLVQLIPRRRRDCDEAGEKGGEDKRLFFLSRFRLRPSPEFVRGIYPCISCRNPQKMPYVCPALADSVLLPFQSTPTLLLSSALCGRL